MTVVAWDGKSIAADKQATCSGMKVLTTKLMRLDTGVVLAWTGSWDSSIAMVDWWKSGAKKEDFPKSQQDKDRWSRLIVADANSVIFYEQEPSAMNVEAPFMAWGTGQDFAMAAMVLGKTAREAVELASNLSNTCGLGVDVEVLKT